MVISGKAMSVPQLPNPAGVIARVDGEEHADHEHRRAGRGNREQ